MAFVGNVKDRVEFTKGSVQYVLSGPDPKAVPVVCFVLDISQSSQANGSLNLIVSTLKQILFSGPTAAARIAFVTYDSRNIHFWDLRSASGRPRMFVSPTPESAVVPGPFSTAVDCSQSTTPLTYLLDHISEFAEPQNGNPSMQQSSPSAMLDHAVTAAANVIRSHKTPGRIVMFTSSAISVPAARDTDVPTPLSTTYRVLGKLCAKDGIGVDLFLFRAPSQVQRRQQDIATLGELTRITGGQFYSYEYGTNYAWAFNADLRRNLTRSWGCRAVLSVRAGKGIYPAEYLGNFLPLGGNTKGKCASFASIDADKAVGVTFAHGSNGGIPVNGNVVFQTALLYVNGADGALCLRVHTLMAPSATVISTVFRSFDCDVMVGLLARKAVDAMRWSGVTPESASEEIVKSTTGALTVYRFSCARNPVAGQLVLPDTLSLLPVYVSCLMKSPLLGAGVHPDLRSAAMYAVASMTPRDMLLSLYPRAFFLDSILPPSVDNGDNGGYEFPRAIRLTIDSYSIDGMYLIDNGGSTVFIFVGESPDADVVEHLFGARDISSYSADALTGAFSVKLQQWMTDSEGLSDGEVVARYPVFCLIQELAKIRGHNCFGIRVVRDLDVRNEPALWSQVYAEDSNKKLPSYTEFLCLVHKRINNNMSQMIH